MVRTLDHAIERLGGRPVAAMDAPVRAAIRLGAYELAFLGGVPARASVNEAVELVKASPARRAAGFANAVLRRVAEGSAISSRASRVHPTGGGVEALVPRLGRRDLVGGVGRG